MKRHLTEILVALQKEGVLVVIAADYDNLARSLLTGENRQNAVELANTHKVMPFLGRVFSGHGNAQILDVEEFRRDGIELQFCDYLH